MSTPTSLTRRFVRGLTMIELMVALVIASILSIAIFGVMLSFEGRKRTTTALNDASQAGNYAMYMVDRLVRGAGSGLGQAGASPRANEDRNARAFGCRILAARSGTAVLPIGGAPPAPFDNVTIGTAGEFRVAPVLILPGQSGGLGFNGEPSDVLMVMGGASGFGEVPIPLTATPAASTLTLRNSVGLTASDLLLLAGQLRASGDVEDCMVQQVATGFSGGTATSVGLSGTYAANTIDGVSPSVYDDQAVALKLGSATGNVPTFSLLGVGDNTTLTAYDLLQTAAPAMQAVADSVFELHAVYGVDSNGDGTLDAWVDPAATPVSSTLDYSVSTLMAGTGTAADRIASIKAIRVALILRSALQEKAADATAQPFTPATLTLFSEVGLDRDRNLTTDERRYRYRVIEATIPLRNALFL